MFDTFLGKFSSSTLLQCIAPPHTPGRVVLDLSFNDGSDFSSNSLEVIYEPAFVINSILPAKLVMGVPNQVVTLIGRNFKAMPGLQCKFGLNHVNSGFYQSSSAVACLAPVNQEGTVMLSLSRNQHYFEGTGISVSYVQALKVDVFPTSGPVHGGTIVTLTSDSISSFTNMRARFDRSLVSCVWISSVWTCMTPAMAFTGKSSQSVVLTILSSETEYSYQTHTFLYYADPIFESLRPTVGPLSSRTKVTFTGTNFVMSSGIVCRFGKDTVKGEEAKYVSSSSIECISPMQSKATTVQVSLSVNAGGDFTMLREEFNYVSTPTLISLFPSSGPASRAGQSVTIFGSQFGGRSGIQCKFGLYRVAPGVRSSSSHVLCDLPPNMAGVVLVAVGVFDSIWSQENVPFQVCPDVKITHLNPSLGPIAGGTPVTVHGIFIGNASATFRFGSVDISCEIRSASLTVCISPAAHLSGDISVQFKSDLFMSEELQYLYLPQMRVSDLMPSIGNHGSRTLVQVSGSGFVESCRCRFGHNHYSAGDARFLTSSLIECVSPVLDIGKTAVEVTANGIDFTFDSKKFLVEVVPVISSLIPSQVSAMEGGQVLTVVGKHFSDSRVLTCLFGSKDQTDGFFLSSTMVTCVAPYKNEGKVAVSISADGMHRPSASAKLLTFSLHRFDLQASPSAGPSSGATRVQIIGLRSPSAFKCQFGTKFVEGFWQSKNAYCTSPPSTSGQMANLSVHGRDGYTFNTNPLYFYFFAEPQIFSMVPLRGPVRGGTPVKLLGSNIPENEVVCRFGNILSAEQQVLSSSQANCIAPAQLSSGFVNVELSD